MRFQKYGIQSTAKMDFSARTRMWFAWLSRQVVISRVTADSVSTPQPQNEA